MFHRLSLRYGWRGLWLMLMGAMWVLFGFGVLTSPPSQPRSWVLYEYMPDLLQASLWWVSGATAMWVGAKGPSRDDSLGHVALYLMPATRLLSFALSWLIFLGSTVATDYFDWSGDPIGLSVGWYAALIWSLVSLMLALAAAWPNPERPIPRPPAGMHKG